MRVCIWTDSDRFAGTERHCVQLAGGLRDEGVEVVMACRPRSPLSQKAVELGLETELLDAARSPLTCLGRMQSMLRTGRVSVLHTHNGVTTALGAMARRGVRRGALVATQHFIAPARTRRRGVLARALGRLQRWNEKGVNRWVAISEAVREAMMQRGDAHESRISLVPNGMPEPLGGEKTRAEARKAIGLDEREWVLVCPARLEAEKDHRTLLSACAMLRAEGLAFRIFCLGEGSLRSPLEAMVDSLNLTDRVRFVGYQGAVEDWIRAADAVVLASPSEPFGLVLLEAMSRSLPVVAADSGGPREILQGGAGVAFFPGDARDLAQKLLALSRDPAQCARIGQAGYARWKQCFTDRRMVESMMAAYAMALKSTDPWD
jgi:glycosyltransferase involved in cell wall biosynthesis